MVLTPETLLVEIKNESTDFLEINLMKLEKSQDCSYLRIMSMTSGIAIFIHTGTFICRLTEDSTIRKKTQ